MQIATIKTPFNTNFNKRVLTRIIHFDHRDPFRTVHPMEKLLKQRVYTLMQGYEDANDVSYLKNDPLLIDILEGDLASQPTISRFENSFNNILFLRFTMHGLIVMLIH